jgi:hypothetical protein
MKHGVALEHGIIVEAVLGVLLNLVVLNATGALCVCVCVCVCVECGWVGVGGDRPGGAGGGGGGVAFAHAAPGGRGRACVVPLQPPEAL